jgi:hypothetical protein
LEKTMAEPAYVRDNPLMGAMFASFIQYLWDQPEARRAFEEQTGTRPLPVAKTRLDVMIDEACGVRAKYMEAFVAWAIETQWGEEGSEATPDG